MGTSWNLWKVSAVSREEGQRLQDKESQHKFFILYIQREAIKIRERVEMNSNNNGEKHTIEERF